MQTGPDDVYAAEARFSDIYDLFQLNQKLRESVPPYLAHAIPAIRNVDIDAFSRNHPAISA